MRIIRSSEYRRMPWKNGGGETVEIAISPAAAALDAFDWRISMAHVASSGPFSRFPGINRTLAVLAGAGIRLKVADRNAVSIDRETPPVVFSGDDPAEADLIDGPIDDLNVMTRRASHRHRLSRIQTAGTVRVQRAGDLLLGMMREAASVVKAGGKACALAAGDTVLLDREDERELEITPAAPGRLYVMELWRA